MSGRAPVIAVLATLDTKRAEARYVSRMVERAGGTARIVDIGLGTQDQCEDADAGATNIQVAARAGSTVAGLRKHARFEAMRAMGEGAGQILRDWYSDAALQGAIALGGNQGTAIASIAMQSLPFGPPKVIVSTVASGNVRDYVMDSDITMQFSVADLLGGPNFITEAVLGRAAAATVAMARSAEETRGQRPDGAVGITAFGNTEPAVIGAIQRLGQAGYHCVPFHASGACGSAMERLVRDGAIDAVLDMTTHEILGEIEPRDIYRPVRPGRLTAAAQTGIPQVFVPGGLEYFCFGGPETIPDEYRDRPTHIHNPYNTNVRTDASNLHDAALLIAARLNESSAPAAVLIPRLGWSGVGSPGGVLHDPIANQSLVSTLEAHLSPRIPIKQFDLAINDPEFAAAAADTLIGLMQLSERTRAARHAQTPQPANEPDETSQGGKTR